MELFDLLMTTEPLGCAERQPSKDKLRRYPRMFRGVDAPGRSSTVNGGRCAVQIANFGEGRLDPVVRVKGGSQLTWRMGCVRAGG